MPAVFSTQSGAHPNFPDLVSAVPIANRNPEFPIIWQCPDHPQWTRDATHPHRTGKAYVAVVDSTPGGMEKMMLAGAREQAPGGGKNSAKKAGE